MANADLSAARLHELLHYDSETGVFTRLTDNNRGQRIGDIAGTLSKHRGYIGIQVDRVIYVAHRLAWLYVYGKWPASVIDHINGVKTDNRIANLREASAYINMQNRHKANRNNRSSGFLGVSRHHTKWRAMIWSDDKLIRIGRFDTPEEAHQAYLTAKRQLHEGCTI